jgi:hypothetical protein
MAMRSGDPYGEMRQRIARLEALTALAFAGPHKDTPNEETRQLIDQYLREFVERSSRSDARDFLRLIHQLAPFTFQSQLEQFAGQLAQQFGEVREEIRKFQSELLNT